MSCSASGVPQGFGLARGLNVAISFVCLMPNLSKLEVNDVCKVGLTLGKSW